MERLKREKSGDGLLKRLEEAKEKELKERVEKEKSRLLGFLESAIKYLNEGEIFFPGKETLSPFKYILSQIKNSLGKKYLLLEKYFSEEFINRGLDLMVNDADFLKELGIEPKDELRGEKIKKLLAQALEELYIFLKENQI